MGAFDDLVPQSSSQQNVVGSGAFDDLVPPKRGVWSDIGSGIENTGMKVIGALGTGADWLARKNAERNLAQAQASGNTDAVDLALAALNDPSASFNSKHENYYQRMRETAPETLPGQLAAGLTYVAAAPFGGAPLVAGVSGVSEGTNRANELRYKGVDSETANRAGAFEGATQAVANLIPGGSGVVKGALYGGGMNAIQQLASDTVAEQLLKPEYAKVAEEYAPTTKKTLIAGATGATLGGALNVPHALASRAALRAKVPEVAPEPAPLQLRHTDPNPIQVFPDGSAAYKSELDAGGLPPNESVTRRGELAGTVKTDAPAVPQPDAAPSMRADTAVDQGMPPRPVDIAPRPDDTGTATPGQHAPTNGMDAVKANAEPGVATIEPVRAPMPEQGTSFRLKNGEPATIHATTEKVDIPPSATGPTGERFTYTAKNKSGKIIGTVTFNKYHDGAVVSEGVEVNPEYRRQGIATSLYRQAEASGLKIIPSEHQSPEGRAFSESRYQHAGVPDGQGIETSPVARPAAAGAPARPYSETPAAVPPRQAQAEPTLPRVRTDADEPAGRAAAGGEPLPRNAAGAAARDAVDGAGRTGQTDAARSDRRPEGATARDEVAAGTDRPAPEQPPAESNRPGDEDDGSFWKKVVEDKQRADEERVRRKAEESNRRKAAVTKVAEEAAQLRQELDAPAPKKGDPDAGTLHANPLGKVAEMARKLLISDGAVAGAKKVADGVLKRIGDIRNGRKAAPGESLLGEAVKNVVDSTGQRLRTLAKIYDSPTLARAAELIQREPGSGKQIAEPLGEAVANRTHEFKNALARPMEEAGMADWWGSLKDGGIAELQQVRRLVQNRDKIDPNTRLGKVAQAWAKTLDDVHAYARAQGLDIGHVENHFPRMVDAVKVATGSNWKAFEADAVRAYEASGLSHEDAVQAAANYAWAKRMEGLGVDETPFIGDIMAGPSKGHMKPRELAKAADTILEKYMIDDPYDALSQYVSNVVRAAEFEARFGGAKRSPSGEKIGQSKYEEMRTALEREGNAALIPAMDAYIKTATGMRVSSDAGKAIASVGQALSTVRFLRLSSLVSLFSEPFTMATRASASPTALPKNLGRAYGYMLNDLALRTARSVLQPLAAKVGVNFEPGKLPGMRDAAQAQRIAQDIGSVLNDMAYSSTHAVMGDSGTGLPTQHAKLSKVVKFSHMLANRATMASSLRAITEAEHSAMVRLASILIRETARDAAKSGLSRRELRDMGIPDAQRDAFVAYVNGLKNPADAIREKATNPLARLYVQALNAVDKQGVMQPTMADKPAPAATPLGSLVYNLTGYMHAFHNNALKRVGRMANDALRNPQGDLTAADRAKLLTPLFAVPLAYMTQYAFTYLYDEVKGTPADKQAKKDEPAKVLGMELPISGRATEALSRMGTFGKFDPWLNMASNARYSRSPAQSLVGPGFGGINDLVTEALKTGSKDDSPNTNTHERLVAKMVYENLIDPAVDTLALTAGTPLTAIVAPQIMRRDETKEAFVTGTAGPKQERGSSRYAGRGGRKTSRY